MKCYEITKCGEKERSSCQVWNGFRDHPEDMEGCACWVLTGAYHEEGGRQAQKCRKCGYYLTINRDTGLGVEHQADVAIITCSGTINMEKTKALEKVWDVVKKNKKNKVLLDIANVNNCYSCGLSMMVKMHREAVAAGGMLLVVGCPQTLYGVLHTTGLAKHLLFVQDRNAGLQHFAALATRKQEEERQKETEARKAAEQQHAAATAATAGRRAAPEAAETAKPVASPPTSQKKYVPCWEYWKNRNPRNATNCDECFHKKSTPQRPCWIVEGLVEGVVFHFINETCVDCRYFEEFAVVHQQ
jgi:anti-anti-sigma factor